MTSSFSDTLIVLFYFTLLLPPVSPKFPYFPLAEDGWPLGYEVRRAKVLDYNVRAISLLSQAPSLSVNQQGLFAKNA